MLYRSIRQNDPIFKLELALFGRGSGDRLLDREARFAALSAEERALVAGVMVDRWGTAEAPAASDEDDDESSLHAQCLDLAALHSGWTDVIVAMAITRVIGTALYAPDAPKIPAPDQTRQLIKTLEQWLDRLDPSGPVFNCTRSKPAT
jgi:hypothetical protein